MKNDTVSRASVLKAIDEYERLSMVSQTVRNMTSLREIVQWLPAVQTCEDAVSRADVLETYADLYDVFEDSRAICKELHKVYDRINALPSVQPEPKPDENGSEPFGNAEMLGDRTTDDCISRQAAIDALSTPHGILYPIRTVEELPSVQPETAKRIVGKSRDGMTLWYQCDMCNEPVDAQDNFCRGCGRRLTDG